MPGDRKLVRVETYRPELDAPLVGRVVRNRQGQRGTAVLRVSPSSAREFGGSLHCELG